MMSAGDLKGCLRKLDTQLRAVKYPREVDYNGLAKGAAAACLPVLSHVFTSFSPLLAEQLVASGVELTGKSDLRFIETIYKALRDQFHYKPSLTKQQFLAVGFAERKVDLLCDVLSLALRRHRELHRAAAAKARPVVQTVRSACRVEALHSAKDTTSTLSSDWPLVERHIRGSALNTVSMTSGKEEEEEEEEQEEEEEEVYTRVFADTPKVEEGRLAALEAQVQRCLSGLGRLSALEARLEVLERHHNQETRDWTSLERDQQETRDWTSLERDQQETRDWTSLETRVLLLETRLQLADMQGGSSLVNGGGDDVRVSAARLSSSQPGHAHHDPGPAPSPAPSHPISPCSETSSQQEGLQQRLERISNMMKDTSSLLKNMEPSEPSGSL